MNSNPVSWFEIYVSDMDRARKFYEAVFECRLNRLNNPDLEIWAFPQRFESYGASGALVKMPGFPPGGNSTLVYFSCKDCSIEESRIDPSGGQIQRSKECIGEYGYITLAIDTEGNMFGLHQPHAAV